MATDACKTVKIASKGVGGYTEINETDFDEKVHGKALTDAEVATLDAEIAKANAKAPVVDPAVGGAQDA